ncbi:MAG: SDR family oxidoreductase [Candidatus Levybacteria bacterium]|nr:SDR family oxidoreductase [Candidatus Levybacteria bacterium]
MTSPKKSVLITGASSGIGKEFARVFAENGYDLLLTGRAESELKKIAYDIQESYGVEVAIKAIDLTTNNAAEKLFDWAITIEPRITCLVNNAGIGNYGKFSKIPWEKENELLQLNITVLTRLCHLFIPYFKEKREGYILNVASMAGFQPGPYFSTYYASKSYVLLFTEALALEHKNDNIHISALCPGPSPTNFFKRANFPNSSFVLKFSMLSPAKVARIGYKGLMQGKTIIIPSFKYHAIPLGSRFFPRKTTAKISKKFVEIASRG